MASRECLDNSEAKKERRNESSKRRKAEFQDGMHKTAFPDTRGVHRLKVEEWRHARPSMLTWCGRTITDGQENRCTGEPCEGQAFDEPLSLGCFPAAPGHSEGNTYMKCLKAACGICIETWTK